MKKILTILSFTLLCSINLFAQGGGKAEANRIEFARGKSAATVSGKIYGDLQAEYVFTASEGQTINLKITSLPKGNFSIFKVLNAYGEPEFTSESDINYQYNFTAPYSGDYLVWVTFRPAGKTKSAKYFLTLSIK